MKRLLFLLLLVTPLMAIDDTDRVNALISSSYITGVQATGSMKPLFDENYLLLCQSAEVRPLKDRKAGDVILFLMKRVGVDGKEEILLVCHTIWSISSGGNMAVTKGVNNECVDRGYVTADSYVGFVVGWVRKDLPEVAALETKAPVRFVLDVPGQK